MKVARLHRSVICLLVLLLGGGCATHALWTETNLDAWNEPDDPPNVKLFQPGRRRDFVVVYNEYSERHDAVRTRAYLLGENESRISQGKRPHFLRVLAAKGLASVPVLAATNIPGVTVPDRPYAIVVTNPPSFTLYLTSGGNLNCRLPVYNDGKGRILRIALTPVTVVADVTIVGGVLGYFVLIGMAESGYSTTLH